MLIPKTLFAVVFFVFGSTLALADSSQLSMMHETEAQSNYQKLGMLELKIQALESRIDKYLPKSSVEVEVGKNPYDSDTVQRMVGWSSQDHLTQAREHHAQIDALGKRIEDLDTRIERFNRKPYLDTKGFKRASLKRIKGNLILDLREATVKTAWHQSQAEKVMLSESTHHNPQQNS
jgi:chaperonin cofactor prefoldin